MSTCVVCDGGRTDSETIDGVSVSKSMRAVRISDLHVHDMTRCRCRLGFAPT